MTLKAVIIFKNFVLLPTPICDSTLFSFTGELLVGTSQQSSRHPHLQSCSTATSCVSVDIHQLSDRNEQMIDCLRQDGRICKRRNLPAITEVQYSEIEAP
ncbi:unnamed protein product, partial [Nesidiocoris tenuis]